MNLTDIEAAVAGCLGISELNPMQAAVAASVAKRIILLSPTGSGKTLAFLTAVLQRYNPAANSARGPQIVVIVPSRELVRQIFDVLRPVCAAFGLKTLALYGGNSFADEESSLRGAMPQIIVSTPGRLLDHVDRRTLGLDDTRAVVLDEYDKILELGFLDQMGRISRHLPVKPDFVMVTSATELTDVPDFVDIERAETVDYRTGANSPRARLRIVNVPSYDRDKLATLAALIRDIAPRGPIIVFVNHREAADRVGRYLDKERISNAVYHGGYDQRQRQLALAKFDSRAAKVLVATDLAARGLDITDVASIIHYHPAADVATFTHRNGRTARVDKTGDIYLVTGPEETVPEFADTDHDFYPDLSRKEPVKAEMEAVYFDRGKRDKLSRGDIAGFVMKQAGVPADAVGKITIGADYSTVAVAAPYVRAVIDTARSAKIKNVKTRPTLL